jgi:hypothetical protein
VHQLLSEAELHQLESFASHRGRTTHECHEFIDQIITARGSSIGRTAVANWLRKFRSERSAGFGVGVVALLANKFDDAFNTVQRLVSQSAGGAMIRRNVICCALAQSFAAHGISGDVSSVLDARFVYTSDNRSCEAEFVLPSLSREQLREAFFA